MLNLVIFYMRIKGDMIYCTKKSFYKVATQIDQYEQERSGCLRYYGGTSLHSLSYRESFFALVRNWFRGGGLYLLDEPAVALSPQWWLTLLLIIYKLMQNGAQFIIAPHSPILLGIPDA